MCVCVVCVCVCVCVCILMLKDMGKAVKNMEFAALRKTIAQEAVPETYADVC